MAATTDKTKPRPPELAPGIELIGRFEDSGFKEPPFIARRDDGQVVQLPEMLYRLVEQVDGKRDHDELAEAFSHAVERRVEADAVEMLIDHKLRPLGVIADADGSLPDVEKADPLLALKFRAKVIPAGAVTSLTTIFRPLFWPPVVVAVVAGMLALAAWLFGVHGISQSLRHLLYDPLLLLMLFAGVVVATAFHETGHATGTRYGGAKPGVMGVGIYIVWPAFYTDITDAYRLGKWGRLRADLGGMYFNAIFALVVAAVYFATGFEALLLLIVLQTFTIIQQSLPFLRFDGYYIISDLTGVPDMFSRVRPVLASLLPGREPDPRVTELKRWVRTVVTAYVILVVPFLLFSFAMALINAPRVFSTAYDSFFVHLDRVGPAFDAGQTASGLVDLLQMVALSLPALGLAYSTMRVGRLAGGAAWRWSADNPRRRAAVVLPVGAALLLTALLWWPNGEYRPIQPGEKGTITGGLQSVADVTTGRPSLTSQRQQQLNGAPTERSQPQHAAPSGSSTTSTSTTTTSTTTGATKTTGTPKPTPTNQSSTTPTAPAQPTGTAPAPDGQHAAPSSSAPPSATNTTTTGAAPTQTAATQTATTPTTTAPTSTAPTATAPTQTATAPTTTTP